MNTAFLFPGQGAQVVGMGKDLAEQSPAAAALFDKASAIVGYDVKNVCFEGPQEKLNATTVSQPAIFVVTAAILEVLKQTHPELKPDVTAGLSMGEYSALYAAGLMRFDEALKLVQKRGQAMQAAADASDGAMVSILGLDEQKVRDLCDQAAQGDVLAPVNFNCPGQIVVSGASAACKRAEQLAEQYGAIKAVELAVAGAFHTSMMAPAARELEQALAECPIQPPAAPKVIANISADYYTGAEAIRQGLVRQLVEPILWQTCMERLLAEGVEKFYEIGPGRVLTGLMKRVSRRTKVVNLSSWQALQDM